MYYIYIILYVHIQGGAPYLAKLVRNKSTYSSRSQGDIFGPDCDVTGMMLCQG